MKPGSKVGRYILGEKIGEGAMAQVYASSHPVLERRVAIKVLKKEACADPHYVTRFLEDARVAHGLDHPNIVRVLDVDDTGAQPFIVMELVDGASLDAWLPEHRLEVGEAARIARDVAHALRVAHEAGMVHRDIKPSNVLIDRNTAAVKLTDFGAAKRERPGAAQLTEMGQRIGTPRYMAPEQIDGSAVDGRADLFALGATLYELLANKPAFDGKTVSAVFHAILFSEPRPLAEVRPDVPPELVGLVEHLLAKAPEARPASAREVVAALAPFVTGGVPADTPPDLTGPRPDLTGPRPDATGPRPAATGPGPVVTGPDATGPRPDATGPGPDPAQTMIGGRAPGPSWQAFMSRGPLVPALLGGAVLVVALGVWWMLSPDTPETPPEEKTVEVEPPEPDLPQQPEGETEREVVVPPEPVAPPESQAEVEPDEPAEEAVRPGTPPPEEPTTTTQLPPVVVEPPADITPAEPVITLECPANSGPGCALAAEALRAVETAAGDAPQLTLNRPDGVYLDGDYLVIDTALPSEVGGYLYLDVLTDAGSVYHLLPEPMREDNEVSAGGEIQVGVEAAERRDGVRFWQVGEPFGEGYLLAIVSENPLYRGLRPVEETIADYQDVLLEALANPATGAKWARAQRLEFRPRDG